MIDQGRSQARDPQDMPFNKGISAFRKSAVMAALSCLAMFSPASAKSIVQRDAYRTSLDPVPFQSTTRSSLGGAGEIRATLAGDNLEVMGAFKDLPSPATRVRLFSGIEIGVPGEPLFELAADKAIAGKVGGSFKLDPSQVQAFRQGYFYIRFDTEIAPDGSAWGWLLPAPAQ